MILLDRDTFTLLMCRQAKVVAGHRAARDNVAISVITRVEVLRGRFDALLKAADGAGLRRAQERLDVSSGEVDAYQAVPVDDAAAAEFDRLRQVRGLRKFGRADLLIACVALANGAILVTRNRRDFEHVPGLRIENWAD